MEYERDRECPRPDPHPEARRHPRVPPRERGNEDLLQIPPHRRRTRHVREGSRHQHARIAARRHRPRRREVGVLLQHHLESHRLNSFGPPDAVIHSPSRRRSFRPSRKTLEKLYSSSVSGVFSCREMTAIQRERVE